ncbi:MAG: adenylate kinase [Candidatus Poseidoniia archaeon]|jgi:adenylate kinase|nr:adenylate kinase [Candidatus Poseidoniia archaeon]MDP6658187.1 adenylate kinase [Candidatus Poseidoniia archaeon]MDP6846155.1 adenylate kinase [Candidatus Poseidoniia archaeon]MDP7007349.1 adenylate kinase [Candidatus Poseidoniia archaeon]|tara:strand:+ start:9873 stop:10406 length:534 start_codon:yes stop_codon:yes gene_type:complete
MGVVVVTGVPGVGKSTVMAGASEAGYGIVNFGDEMFAVAQAEGVADRDQMRTLPVDAQQRMQKLAGERIAAMGDVVVDTHASIRTAQGFMPGLPEWTLRAMAPAIIVLVEATPAEIAGRRARDASRQRDADDVALHQSVNRAFAAAGAVMVGATVAIVENHDGGVDAAVAQFRSLLA